ncbi:MAG: hypothetical protein JJT78_13040 [Leptospira sp.]|nr:hypothetical protein [Leptospira sp.]
MKRKILIISFGVILLLKASDWILFDRLYFKFPNETEWDTSPWYNFLDYTKKLRFSEEETGVLFVGSSVALYSTLPHLISDPNHSEHPFRADIYSHVAMAPTDVKYYLDDIISKKPKIVVYVFNPADFQMEFITPKTDDSIGNISEELNYDYSEWLDHFSWRHPARLIYPNQFVLDYFGDLSRNQIYRLWGKGFLYINRYREFFWDSIFAYIERHFRRGRSFHIYTGSEPKEGIWQHGWTLPEFSLNCELVDGVWKDSVYIPQSDTEITIEFPSGKRQNFNFTKTGWQTIKIDDSLLGDESGENLNSGEDASQDQKSGEVTLKFSISKSYSSRYAENKPYGKEYEYGIRLSQNFCSSKRLRDFSYIRPNFLEESRFRNMSLEEYRKDYFERIYRDNEKRPELTRMKSLSEKKEMIADTDFLPWSEINRFREIQDRLEKESILFLMVMSPENPIELKKYRGGRWYNGMLDYFGELSGGHFFDYGNFLKDERDFSDPHHLTYEGAVKFSAELKGIISRELEQGEGHE